MNVCLYGWMVMLSLTSLLVFSACNNEKIPEDTLVKVYTDIVIAQDTTSGPSANHTAIKNSVFKRYNISAEEYEASIKRMESNPELWESFFNKTIEHVEKMRAKEREKKE